MTRLRKIFLAARAAFLAERAHDLAASGQAGKGLEAILSAYKLLDFPAPSKAAPIELNLRLALIAVAANRLDVSRAAGIVASEQAEDRTNAMPDEDRKYLLAFAHHIVRVSSENIVDSIDLTLYELRELDVRRVSRTLRRQFPFSDYYERILNQEHPGLV